MLYNNVKVIFIFYSILSSPEVFTVNHTLIYENSELKVSKNTKFLKYLITDQKIY